MTWLHKSKIHELNTEKEEIGETQTSCLISSLVPTLVFWFWYALIW